MAVAGDGFGEGAPLIGRQGVGVFEAIGRKSSLTRLALQADRVASIEEVVSRIDIALRPAVRRAAESVACVRDLLHQKMDPPVRDAIAAVRDQIEMKRVPKDACVAKALLQACPSAKIPHVHEITTEDVEAFLQTLKTRDGRTAVRKSWNTIRADLHSFFGWCASKQRRLCAENVVSDTVKFKLARGVPHVLTVQQARELMAYVAGYRGGVMAKYFALALFAGLRTGGELTKLAQHPDSNKLIDLERRVIHVQPDISKTGQYRQTTIRPALLAWLTHFEGDIWPRNGDRHLKHVRRRFKLLHDVLRHSFFSYLVSAEGSVERAALEGGNTEGILRRHYLNLANSHEAEAFWQIVPLQ